MTPRISNEKESRKKPLTPEIIRRDMKRSAGRTLAIGLPVGIIMIAIAALLPVFLWPTDPQDTGAIPLILGILACLVCGIMVAVRACVSFRRAMRGEIVIEQDTVAYVETDRARTVRNGNHVRGPVYEDYLHFKSGRELQVDRYKYRESDGEVFITVAYAAEPDTVLRIYRLADYHWQE